jgi:hypothetical protein
MVKLLPGIDGIGKSRSFFQDPFGFFRDIPKAILRYDPFDFLEPLFSFI